MSHMSYVRARLVPDPSLGVADLQRCLSVFLEQTKTQKSFDLLQFVTPPGGATWKSSCCCSWVVHMAPLLENYLGVARNGVVPTKKHKQALSSLNEAQKLNNGRRKDGDWVDLVDDFIRMSLAHLRGLLLVDGAKLRAFRKIDVHQQQVLTKLLDMLELPNELLAIGEEQALSVAPTRADSARSISVLSKKESQAEEPTLEPKPLQDIDPCAIFQRVLQQRDSDSSIPDKAETTKALKKAPALQNSPEQGFLPGLLLDDSLNDEDRKLLQSCQAQQPPVKGQKTGTAAAKLKAEGKASAKSKAQAKAKAKAKAKSVKKACQEENKASGRGKWLPDHMVDRTTLRKRFLSRAWHGAFNAAQAAGKSEALSRKMGRRASRKAGVSFDKENPRPVKVKNSKTKKGKGGPAVDDQEPKDDQAVSVTSTGKGCDEDGESIVQPGIKKKKKVQEKKKKKTDTEPIEYVGTESTGPKKRKKKKHAKSAEAASSM